MGGSGRARTRRWFACGLLAGLALGCGSSEDPCLSMCAAATDRYAACLEEWGVSWTDAGYDDRAGFRASCDTWAWQGRMLEDDAGAEGALDAVCAARGAALREGTCDDFTAIDWSRYPWEPATR